MDDSGARIRRNSVVNTAGALGPAIVALVTVPLYLQTIGAARYGILAVIWVLVAYFRVFDLGLGRATANLVARLGDDVEARGAVVWTAFVLNTLFGIVGGLVLVGVGYLLLGHVIDVPEDLRNEALDALPLLGAMVPALTISAVAIGALEGREHFVAVNVVETVGVMLSQIVPLALALWRGPELPWLVAGAAGATGAVLIGWLLVCRTLVVPHLEPSFERSLVGRLVRYGGWVTLTGLVSPVLEVMDRIVVGAVAGAAAVAAYSIPFNLVSRLAILPHAVIRAAFPRFSMFEEARARTLAVDALRGLAIVLTAGVVTGAILVRPFMETWIGGEIAADAAPVAEVLLLGFWLNGIGYVPFALLQAQGRPDLPAKLHVAEVVPFLALLWVLLSTFGIVGAALAWGARSAIDAVLLFWASGLGHSVPRDLWIGFALAAGTVACALLLFPEPLARVGLGGGLLAVTAIWSWRRLPHGLRARLPLRRGWSSGGA